MSEEKKIDNNESVDVVPKEDYNRIVEAHNKLKMELQKVEEEKKQNIEKDNWQKLSEDLKKQMEELKESVKQKEEIKVAKGIVSGLQSSQASHQEVSKEKVLEELERQIPTDDVKDVTNLSPIQRYGYYKSPTRGYSNQVLGKALSLDAGRFRSGQAETSRYASPSPNDTVVYTNKRVLG